MIRYDLTEIFEQLKFLNISAVASQAKINESLMRQYVSGVKFPSAKRLKSIEKTVHELGAIMQKVEIVPTQK